MKRYLFFVRIFWAFILAISLFLVLSDGGELRPEPLDYGKTPVLFVHGWGLSSSNWRPMITYLIKIGYPPEYLLSVSIVPNSMGNIQAATTVLAPAVQTLLLNARKAANIAGYRDDFPQKVDLVGHSMGGLSTRWYAAKVRPDLVRTWISLAGANHGSNAVCAWKDDGARDMCPAFATTVEESQVQIELNGTPGAPLDETPHGLGVDGAAISSIPPDGTRNILYFTVRIDPDRWIKPENSALLDGAGGVPVSIPSEVPIVETSSGNYLFQGSANHDNLPKHPDAIRFIGVLLAVRDQAFSFNLSPDWSNIRTPKSETPVTTIGQNPGGILIFKRY